MEITNEQLAKFCATLVQQTKYKFTGRGLENNQLIRCKDVILEDIVLKFPDASVIDKMWDELLEI